ncbi:MAG TPA: hypothetical protein VGE74_17665 [Gemmata sp.]
MSHDRRSVIAALGLVLPLGFPGRSAAAAPPVARPAVLRFRSFEEAVRDAFATARPRATCDPFPCRRVEVGHSELLATGVQGCHNDRPFAGFPAGHLRIVRTGSEPGPVVCGVRLYVATVDVVLAGDPERGSATRPLDFSVLSPAPSLGVAVADSAPEPAAGAGHRVTSDPVRPLKKSTRAPI